MAKAHIEVPFVGKEASDLLLWRDIKKSGIVFGAATAAFAYFQFSPVGPIVHFFFLLSALTGALFIWSQAAAILSRPGPPVPALLKEGVSEEDIRSFAEHVRGPINSALATVALLASGKDLKLSLLVTVGAYLASKVFAVVPILILVYSVFFLAFTLPKAYEFKKDEADQVLSLVRTKVNELIVKFQDNVLSKIPKAKKQ